MLLAKAAALACVLSLHPSVPFATPLVATAAASSAGESSAAVSRPNFSGVWRLEKSENQVAFMKAIGYNFLIAQAAFLAQVTQRIDHQGDEITFTFEVMPPLLAPTRTSVVKVGVLETPMTDDAGRDMLLLSPFWNGTVFQSGLRYLKPQHELTIDRYMEDEKMVEHVRYPAKGIEMRRIFRKAE